MKKQIRDYQQKFIADIRASMAAGNKRVIASLPTGAGKTACAIEIIRAALSRGSIVDVLVERLALIDQWSAALSEAGLSPGIVQAGTNTYGQDALSLWSVQTCISQEKWPGGPPADRRRVLPGDVEVLTAAGWKRFEDVGGADRFAQWNADTEAVTFTAGQIIRKHRDGPLVRLHGASRCDVRMTPNHQLCVRYQDGIRKPTVVDAVFNGLRRMPASGRGVGPDRSITPFQRLMVAMQADGTMHHRCMDGTCILAFSFVKSRKIKRLLAICADGGWGVSEVKDRAPRRRFLVRGVPRASKNLWDHFNLTQASHAMAAGNRRGDAGVGRQPREAQHAPVLLHRQGFDRLLPVRVRPGGVPQPSAVEAG